MKEFNLIIVGVGGQGILTLQRVIIEAALKQGYDVKSSELHGLAQRGGGVSSHIRFGEKIYSSLVMQGEVDLIIGLEALEALRACRYGSEKKTVLLVDTYKITPISVTVLDEKYPSIDNIVNTLRQFSSKVITLDASEIVKKEVGTIAPANVYMVAYAVSKDLIPIKKEVLLESIKENVRKKYFEMNKKVFRLAFK